MSGLDRRSANRGETDHVLAIDIGGTKIDIALALADGTVRERIRLDTLAESGPEQALKRIAAATNDFIDMAADRYGAQVGAFAAVCPGVVQPDRILLAPNLPGWEDVALGRTLAAEFGVDHVAISNDVRAGALAEARYGALRGTTAGIYISLGTGIAASLVVDGKVLPGAHEAAGEIAYTVPTWCRPEDLGAGRPLLEEMVGGKALETRAEVLFGGADLVAIAELFGGADGVVHRDVENILDALAIAIANLAVFVDPQTVAVGGGMMASARTILPAINRRLKEVVPFPPALVPARFAEDASLYGAVALAADSLDIQDVPDRFNEGAEACS
jgi:glucokinase